MYDLGWVGQAHHSEGTQAVLVSPAGRGMPFLRGHGRGDLIVTVLVRTPVSLTPKQRELFEELAQTLGTETQGREEKGFFKKMRDALGK